MKRSLVNLSTIPNLLNLKVHSLILPPKTPTPKSEDSPIHLLRPYA